MKSYFILVLLKSFSLRIQLRLTQKDKLERKVAKETGQKMDEPFSLVNLHLYIMETSLQNGENMS